MCEEVKVLVVANAACTAEAKRLPVCPFAVAVVLLLLLLVPLLVVGVVFLIPLLVLFSLTVAGVAVLVSGTFNVLLIFV